MSEIKITESALKQKNISYILNTLNEVLIQVNGKTNLSLGNNRCELILDVKDSFYDLVVLEVEDKISDIICVNYKYNFFNKKISTNGLNNVERELLLCSLISADIDEDKKYVIKKLKNFNEYSIDGIFNFRMKPLKEKWIEIASYIPYTFGSLQLKDFISYIIKDKANKKVYFENGKLYDKHFNELKRSELIGDKNDSCKLVKEIMLSSASEVELGSKINEIDEYYLKEFYQDRVILGQNYNNIN